MHGETVKFNKIGTEPKILPRSWPITRDEKGRILHCTNPRWGKRKLRHCILFTSLRHKEHCVGRNYPGFGLDGRRLNSGGRGV